MWRGCPARGTASSGRGHGGGNGRGRGGETVWDLHVSACSYVTL